MLPQLHLTRHAGVRAQQRGVSRDTVELIARLGDCKRRTAGGAFALSLSARARRAWACKGIAPADLDRSRGVVLIVNLDDGAIITVEHGHQRRLRH